MQYYCIACLKTDINLHIMTSDEVHFFGDVICKNTARSGNSMHICAICRCVLQKFIRFIRQCVSTQKILRESISQDVKYNHPSQFLSLTSTPPNVLYVGPDQVTIKSEEEVDGFGSDEDNVPLVMLGRNGDAHDDAPSDDNGDYDVKYSQPSRFLSLTSTAPNVLYVGPDQVSIKSEEEVDGFGSDEDNVPLVMLGRNGDAHDDAPGDDNGDDKTPEIKSEPVPELKSEPAPEPAPELNGHIKKREKKSSRKKKELREGFTSRMVQETDEYLVIKLSKEQVLQEMAENAKSMRFVAAPYKCEKCVKGFNFEDVLETHMAKHSPDIGKFQCELCTQYCASAVSLRGHMKSHTTRYKCKVCGIVRLSRQHILEHHGIAHTAAATAYTCDECGFTTNKRTVIQNHVRSHKAREPHACHLCGKLYKNVETLRIHIMRHESKRHACGRCAARFPHAAQLARHERAAHERRDFYCVECDLLFGSADTLRMHFQRAKPHRDASSFKYACPECPSRFISLATLATHHGSRHGARGQRACAQCPASTRTYSSAASLRSHVRRAHGGGGLIARKNISALHKHTHTGEKPNVCACDASVERPASASIRAQKTARHKYSEEESQAESITTPKNEQ